MSARDRFQRVDALFQEALHLAGPDRERFLAEACDGDEALGDEIRRLLAEDARTRGAIDEPALGGALREVIDSREDDARPARIGPYRIARLIAEGGFGSVYLGEQEEPIRREVAVKVIKLGMDTRRVIARFEAERQALAMMDHPNIAKVYEAGTTDQGRPYFVMEYVRGVPITEFCDEHNVSTRGRLELFLQVCSAAQHAHQKGIIHRDIKPSNVLVTGQGTDASPRVIDFGIAKAINQRLTERTIFTEHRQMIGTPAYMSPEQTGLCDGDIDTRSDIYSLGVLLYELLTGTTPFETRTLHNAALDEIARIIREMEPPRPSTRLASRRTGGTGGAPTASAEDEERPSRQDPPGEDGAAIEEVARRRRTDPTTLARQVRGDLDWIVMKALEKDRARRYESAGDFARDVERHLRHEAVMAGPPSAAYRARKFVRRNRVGVVAGSIVVAALVIGCGLAITGLVHAARERDNAVLERDKAEAINTFLIDDLLAEAAPDRNPVGAEMTVRELLDRAGANARDGFDGQPEVEAAVRGVIGDTYQALGLYDEAERHWRRSLDIRRAILGRDAPDTMRALAGLAMALDHQGDFEEAEPLHARLVEVSARVHGPLHREALGARNNHAELFVAQGRLEEGRLLHEATLRDRREALGAEHADVLESMNNLAAVYFLQDRHADAERLFRETWEGRKAVLGEAHPYTLVTMSNLGIVLKNRGKLAEAEPLLRRALEIDAHVQGPEHPDTLTDMHNLAILLSDQRKLEEAEALFREVIGLRKRVLGPDHPVTAYSLVGLGVCLVRQSRFEEAEPHLREGWAQRARTLPTGHHLTAGAALELARCLLALERHAAAEEVLIPMFNEAEEAGASQHSMGELSRLIVELYEAWQRPDRAEAWRLARPNEDDDDARTPGP